MPGIGDAAINMSDPTNPSGSSLCTATPNGMKGFKNYEWWHEEKAWQRYKPGWWKLVRRGPLKEGHLIRAQVGSGQIKQGEKGEKERVSSQGNSVFKTPKVGENMACVWKWQKSSVAAQNKKRDERRHLWGKNIRGKSNLPWGSHIGLKNTAHFKPLLLDNNILKLFLAPYPQGSERGLFRRKLR